MPDEPIVAHALVQAYIRGQQPADALQSRLQAPDARMALATLINIIDRLTADTDIAAFDGLRIGDHSFSKIDELLTAALSGESGTAATDAFLGGLLNSPVFYERVFRRLSETSKVTSASDPKPQTGMPAELQQLERPSRTALFKAVNQRTANSTSADVAHPGKIKKTTAIEPDKPVVDLPGATGGGTLFNRLLAVAAVLVVLIIAGPVIYLAFQDSAGSLDHDLVEGKPIYDIFKTTRRGSEEGLSAAQLQLLDGLGQAIPCYQKGDYRRVIEILGEYRGYAKLSDADTLDKPVADALRNFYSSLGISFTAELIENPAKIALADSALQYLRHAATLQERFTLKEADREIYFSGRVNFLVKRFEAAKENFHQIPPKSPFYKDSQFFLEKMNSGK